MIIPAPFWQSETKVATPLLSGGPTPDEIELNVYPEFNYSLPVSCATPGSHIFFTKNGSQPTHTGDTATGVTIRIGASSGNINLPLGHYNVVAIGYLPSLSDSDPATQRYFIYRDSGE